jgi:hypothetical protein
MYEKRSSEVAINSGWLKAQAANASCNSHHSLWALWTGQSVSIQYCVIWDEIVVCLGCSQYEVLDREDTSSSFLTVKAHVS